MGTSLRCSPMAPRAAVCARLRLNPRPKCVHPRISSVRHLWWQGDAIGHVNGQFVVPARGQLKVHTLAAHGTSCRVALTRASHPANVRIKQADVLEPLADWMGELLPPDGIDVTVDTLVGASLRPTSPVCGRPNSGNGSVTRRY
jgi:hypothetical protein